ncbi:MAG: VWA domain-containing protein, partial [Thermoplasmata archaeon]|nr:VWA domain-containing protein [Thermoplasmata archaeon]
NLADLTRTYSYNTLPVPTPLSDNHLRTREGLFAKGVESDLISTQFENTDTLNRSDHRTIVQSWQLRSLDHSTFESPLVEMMYLALHWFETPDDHPELISRDCNIWFENDHPVIGNSFILIVEIANLGGSPGGGTVRIMDGNTMVKSENIHLDPDSVATIEAIWKPLYAGVRTLEITLDKHDEHDEVFDVFNNVISETRRVYFFWDDLEMDSDNWEHESTVMYINGESPIDYLDEYGTPLDTNIVDEWDETISHGGNWTRDQYHSSPYSFYLKESKGASGTTSDIVLGMIIDNSRSMTERTNIDGDTWLEVAKVAAKGFVSGLSENSAVCIWKFGGANVVQVLPVTSLTGAGRNSVYNAIDSISQGQMTSIWDGIGSAYTSVKAAEGAYPDHLKVVVALSDGADYRSNDHSGFQASKLEAASTDWAPWHDMQPESGYPIVKYNQHVGKYVVPFNDPIPGRWQTAGGASFKGNRMGLLSSDVPIYTIGLGLEHYDPPDSPQTIGYAGNGNQDAFAVYVGPSSLESGTTEYNLWRISNTSEAEYFYAPDPDDLADIFDKIGKLIAVPTNQTRGGEDTRADPEPNEDKWAVTQTFDLSSAEKASISFWNKYFMVDGTNGGFLLVGYKDPTVDSGPLGDAITDWDWKVVIPTSGFYTGNLYLGVDRYDSFGNRILWCWNGISGEGTFEWEYVDFDILDYIPKDYRSEVKLNFSYIQYGGGTGFGWYMDDIKMRVTRINEDAVTTSTDDMWQMITGSIAAGTTHSGTKAWFSGNLKDKGGDFNDGVDTSLYTRPIDLTNSQTARLSAYFKFNFDMEAGRPPDGFRVEVSKDNGLSWHTLSLGVRASWGVSGSGDDIDDGILDKKAYTGLGDSHGWVNSYTLTRLQTDLDGFIGHSIILRFRVVTNNVDSDHFEDGDAPRGFYVDDIIVFGNSLEQSRSLDDGIDTSYDLAFEPTTFNDDEEPPLLGAPIVEEELKETSITSDHSQETRITSNDSVNENGLGSIFWALIGAVSIMAVTVLMRKYIRTGKVIAKGA